MVTVISWTSCTKSKYIYRTFFYTVFITTFTDLAFLLTLHMVIYWTWLHTKINNICMSDPNPVAFQNSCSMYTILYIYIYIYIYMALQCSKIFHNKVSSEFLRQDSQSLYNFGKIQNVGETELSLEKDLIFRFRLYFSASFALHFIVSDT